MKTTISFYAQYDVKMWEQEMGRSVELARKSSCSELEYFKHTISLVLNELAYVIDRLIAHVFCLLGLQWKSRWPWYSPICVSENGSVLYLGALPIVEKICGKTLRDDEESFIQPHVQAIVSMTKFSRSSPMALKCECPLVVLPPQDNAVKGEDLDKTVEFIDWNLSQGRSTLVHDVTGRGVSVVPVLCYLMKYQGMKFEKAFTHVQKIRPQVHLTPVQKAVVLDYVDSLSSAKA